LRMQNAELRIEHPHPNSMVFFIFNSQFSISRRERV
jgi:hypothetical protein